MKLDGKICQGWDKKDVKERIVFGDKVAVVKTLQVWEGGLSNGGVVKGFQDIAIKRCFRMECQRPDSGDIFL